MWMLVHTAMPNGTSYTDTDILKQSMDTYFWVLTDTDSCHLRYTCFMIEAKVNGQHVHV